MAPIIYVHSHIFSARYIPGLELEKWRYQSSDQVWAGLADAIVRQVSDRLSPYEREKFLLRLNLNRVDTQVIRNKIWDFILNIFILRFNIIDTLKCEFLKY